MGLSSLDLTQELIHFNTINPPGDEESCAKYLAGILEAAGFQIELISFGERRAQLMARKGESSGKPPLCFTGHLDTVPLGSKPWSVDPFAAEVKNGKVYGRGSSDMKSGVAAFVVAAARLANSLNEVGLVLIITAGEETGCDGAADLAARRGFLGKAGAIVVAEPTGNRPLVGHKGALWLKAETQGVTAHGSMPEKGVNAIYKASRAVAALEHFDFNLAPHDVMGVPTLNVGTIQGGININSVPDRAAIGIDIRTIPGQRHSRIHEELASYLGPDIALETIMSAESVWTDPNDSWMQEVFRIVQDVIGRESTPAAASYFTDASALKPALGSPPTVILGPGELAMAHQTDEYCLVDRISEAVEIYSALIRRWCYS